jgi:hypothetical protein
MPNNIPRPRNDDFEEFGGREQQGDDDRAPIAHPRTQVQGPWQPNMVGRCGFCDLVARVNEQVRRANGSAGCPRCGGDFGFFQEDQALPNIAPIDLTRGFRAGSTGRCNQCGLIARVFEDAMREDGTASCEMCGRGTFEFTCGLPNTSFRAPGPKPVYDHVFNGQSYKLPRHVPIEMIEMVLSALGSGKSVDEIINDPTAHERFQQNGFTRFVVEEIRKVENLRRWVSHQTLFYSDEERTRLSGFKMLRVPLAGRAKIQFPGLRGPVERWVAPQTLAAIQAGTTQIYFDGHYKVIEAAATAEDPRFQMAKQFFGKCNALLARGLLRAWTPGGDEIPVAQGNWANPDQRPEGPPSGPPLPDSGSNDD